MKMWILLASLMVSLAAAAPPGGNLAVLDFAGSDGVSASDLRVISDRLETELIQSGVFTVLERRRMNDILSEQGFQQSGACSAQNCEVQIGQMLGVDKILTGSLGKVGNVYSLNVKLLDVSSGQILKSQAIDVTGDISQVLTQGCKILAANISGKVDSTSAVTIKSPSHTALWVTGGTILTAALGTGAYLFFSSSPSTKTVTRTHVTGTDSN